MYRCNILNFCIIFAVILPFKASAKNIKKIIITGSSTVAPLVMEMSKLFEKENPSIRIDVQTGGSSRGIADAEKGVSDIGMVSRALKSTEKHLKSFAIAKDGITMIVHKNNKITNLSKSEIHAIYTGNKTSWESFGWTNKPITVVHKASGRSTQELFNKFLGVKNSKVIPHVIIGDNEQGIKTVSGNPNSIGYVSIGAAEISVKNLVPIKIIKIDGIEASTQSVANGSFPTSRILNLVTTKPPKGIIKQFIQFAQSNEVKNLVQKQYYVPIQN